MLLNCKSFHMDRQRLTSILYRCSLTNQIIKSLHLARLEFFNLFLHNIIKCLRVLIRKVNFVKFLLKSSIFESFVNKLWLSRFRGTYQSNKDAIFCRNYLVHSLGERKMHPAALQRNPTWTVESSQNFKR